MACVPLARRAYRGKQAIKVQIQRRLRLFPNRNVPRDPFRMPYSLWCNLSEASSFCLGLEAKFFVNLRANIANCKVQLKKEQISFTVSIGVAFSRSDYRLDELLELADEALYRTKENGRNRVEIA